jgi:DNA-binding transcriptional ArsR family regulator
MHAFDVLGDPVCRRILELLANSEHSSGDLVAVIGREYGVSQPAVSQHLKVLREGGFATVRADAQRRLYSIDSAPLEEIDRWLDGFRAFWELKLDSPPRSPAASASAGSDRSRRVGLRPASLRHRASWPLDLSRALP